MNIIRAIIFLTSISASLSVSNSILSFRLKNQCSASVSTTDFGATLKGKAFKVDDSLYYRRISLVHRPYCVPDCPVPDINGVLQPSSTQVSSPATIREVLMKWSLDQYKNPKMKIVLDAISPSMLFSTSKKYRIGFVVHRARDISIKKPDFKQSGTNFSQQPPLLSIVSL